MISLSQGPYTYNRFEESAKPDYLDFDKDGDKKEPMKKALKEKGKGKKKIEEGEMPDFIQKKIDEKKKKEGKKDDDCECKHSKDKKKDVAEGLKPLPVAKMAMQASKAYDKENAAVRDGNEPEANKQMQRRIAMMSPAVRRTALANKKMVKEDVCNYLMEGGFANNPVSAEVLFNHMSEDWLEYITAELETA